MIISVKEINAMPSHYTLVESERVRPKGDKFSVEGGYMVIPERLEVVAGYQSQDADGYAESWNRTSVGVNCFAKKHDVKLQVTYRFGENKDGKDGNDLDELFVQTQYVF